MCKLFLYWGVICMILCVCVSKEIPPQKNSGLQSWISSFTPRLHRWTNAFVFCQATHWLLWWCTDSWAKQVLKIPEKGLGEGEWANNTINDFGLLLFWGNLAEAYLGDDPRETCATFEIIWIHMLNCWPLLQCMELCLVPGSLLITRFGSSVPYQGDDDPQICGNNSGDSEFGWHNLHNVKMLNMWPRGQFVPFFWMSWKYVSNFQDVSSYFIVSLCFLLEWYTLVHHSTVLCSNCRRDDLRIWFKREELAHTGAHKINNAIGQAGKWSRCITKIPYVFPCISEFWEELWALHMGGKDGFGFNNIIIYSYLIMIFILIFTCIYIYIVK